MNTVQPYPPNTRWFFKDHATGHEQMRVLALRADPAGANISDAYTPEETNVHALWRIWAQDAAGRWHERWPEHFRPGEVPISWDIVTSVHDGDYEDFGPAPHVRDWRDPYRSPLAGPPAEDFLSRYTHPVHADTLERLNWLRLPVLDRSWNTDLWGANCGGFIQEATGWKPSPLQSTMNVVEIGQAAGLWVPDRC